MRMPLRSTVLASACSLLLAACATPQSGKQESTAKAAASAPASVAPPPLIPRKVLFGNPERAAGEISPDGRWLGFVAPDEGVLNVFVAPREHPDQAKVITHDRKRGVRNFNFAYDGKHLLYPQDEGGNENFHIYSVDLDSGKQTDLTPFKNARADLAGLTPKHPHDVLVNANDRNAKYFDPIRIDLRNGKRERLIKNDGYAGFTTDDDFNLRLASKSLETAAANGSSAAAPPGSRTARCPRPIVVDERVGFTRDGKTLYMLDSRERDTAALFAVDWASGKRSVVHEDARADVGGILASEDRRRARGVGRLPAHRVDRARSGHPEGFRLSEDAWRRRRQCRQPERRRQVLGRRADALGCVAEVLPLRSWRRQGNFWFDVRPALAHETSRSCTRLRFRRAMA